MSECKYSYLLLGREYIFKRSVYVICIFFPLNYKLIRKRILSRLMESRFFLELYSNALRRGKGR